jgi:hypothetical protein
MAYPPSSQRPPPVRQYAPSPASAAAPYAQGDMYGAGDYPPDPGSEDPAYGYQPGPPGPPGPYGSSNAPRSMRPPGPSGSGRPMGPPNGRGYAGDRPPPQKRRGPPSKSTACDHSNHLRSGILTLSSKRPPPTRIRQPFPCCLPERSPGPPRSSRP